MRRVTAIRTPTVKSMRDWWSRLFGNHAGNGASDHSAKSLIISVSKPYLKSNLEALYRNEKWRNCMAGPYGN